jgi:hypothetical protein
MDMERRDSSRRFVGLGAVLAATLAVCSCTTEVQPIGPPEVRVRQDPKELLGTSKILRDGEEVGALRTFRVHGPAGNHVVQEVRDVHLNTLGYIDEQSCAWRYSAHEGPMCVANSSDRRRNVAAILGAYGAAVEIVEAEPASVQERSEPLPRTAPRPAR